MAGADGESRGAECKSPHRKLYRESQAEKGRDDKRGEAVSHAAATHTHTHTGIFVSDYV